MERFKIGNKVQLTRTGKFILVDSLGLDSNSPLLNKVYTINKIWLHGYGTDNDEDNLAFNIVDCKSSIEFTTLFSEDIELV